MRTDTQTGKLALKLTTTTTTTTNVTTTTSTSQQASKQDIHSPDTAGGSISVGRYDTTRTRDHLAVPVVSISKWYV